jgi:hypothetical protein
MNSYLIKGGGLLTQHEDISLIKEVDSFIAMYSNQNINFTTE